MWFTWGPHAATQEKAALRAPVALLGMVDVKMTIIYYTFMALDMFKVDGCTL